MRFEEYLDRFYEEHAHEIPHLALEESQKRADELVARWLRKQRSARRMRSRRILAGAAIAAALVAVALPLTLTQPWNTAPQNAMMESMVAGVTEEAAAEEAAPLQKEAAAEEPAEMEEALEESGPAEKWAAGEAPAAEEAPEGWYPEPEEEAPAEDNIASVVTRRNIPEIYQPCSPDLPAGYSEQIAVLPAEDFGPDASFVEYHFFTEDGASQMNIFLCSQEGMYDFFDEPVTLASPESVTASQLQDLLEPAENGLNGILAFKAQGNYVRIYGSNVPAKDLAEVIRSMTD